MGRRVGVRVKVGRRRNDGISPSGRSEGRPGTVSVIASGGLTPCVWLRRLFTCVSFFIGFDDASIVQLGRERASELGYLSLWLDRPVVSLNKLPSSIATCSA